ncbi:hypothetical protein [uncultured Legionella sp.]|uniref:hypothetical protein n=1 Tax=uncultured Legionella sp. TaxID=210934 RepID=UPI00260184C4|nr:hypothetical protein [uncultured Legionella sp.]
MKSNSPITAISASPSSFGFLFGGTTQVVTLTNNGSVDAYNIQVLTPPGLGVGVSNNCPASLPYTAPNNTCQLSFTSGSTTGTTKAMIAGSNTNTLIEGISVDPELAPLAITGGESMTLFSNDVGAVGRMAIKNNSATVTATNITANLAPTALNERIIPNASNCTSVAPGASCILRFIVTKTAAVAGATDIPATSFAISGSNTTQETGTLVLATVTTVPSVGSPSQGGIVACTDSSLMDFSTLYLVTPKADTSQSGIQWGPTNKYVGAINSYDGASNTQMIVQATPSGMSDIATLCSAYQDHEDGSSCYPYDSGVCYEDWYAPAYGELECMYNNQDVIGNFTSTYYWSSTEVDDSRGLLLDFKGSSINFGIPEFKNKHYRLRCVRAVTN